MNFVSPVKNWESPNLMEKDFYHSGDFPGEAYLPEKLEEIGSGNTIVSFGKVVKKNIVQLIVVTGVVKFSLKNKMGSSISEFLEKAFWVGLIIFWMNGVMT